MIHSGRHVIQEIQGLRALAVLAVLLYHIWPALIPGGYIGVDVFFVISGYLITGTLIREIEATGGINLLNFYARRIRRLMPAATVVTIAVALSLPLFLRSKWGDIVSSILASTLYVQNWFLASQAVDYLADDAKGPMNHFWSLSVEEQYYIIWPLVLILGIHLARRSNLNLRLVLGGITGLIGLGSLAYSVFLTPRNPEMAYFATSTRAWELALGGTLAIFHTRPNLSLNLRVLLALVGLGAIFTSCIAYSNATVFPGYAALLPTLGAAAVILSSGPGAPWPVGVLLTVKPVKYLGDISYSLYLWHWPLIVISQETTREGIGFREGLALLLLSLALAHVTKIFIEDVFRSRTFTTNRTLAAGAGCIALIIAAGVGFMMPDKDEERVVISGDAPRGALAMRDPRYDWAKEDLAKVVPEIRKLRKDIPSAYAKKCHQTTQGTDVLSCDYGNPDSAIKIVMLGDSNATQWFPAFEDIVQRRSVYFRGVGKSACLFSLQEIGTGEKARPYTECLEWTKNVISWLQREKPDLVLIAQTSAYGTGHMKGMMDAWKQLIDSGLNVVGFQSIPLVPFRPDECLSKSNDPLVECKIDHASAFKSDAVFSVADRLNIKSIRISDYMCKEGVCPLVIGGVIVYRDQDHITSTFARTFSTVLEEKLFSQGAKLSKKLPPRQAYHD